MNLSKPKPEKAPKEYHFRTFSIPLHMVLGLERYVDHGQLTGHFLTAVLENDLTTAVARADGVNIKNIPAYVGYMYNEMPSAAWGSPERVRAWCNLGGLEGAKGSAEKEAEDKINHYDETRPLADGIVKNTLTGEVEYIDPPPPITKFGENT